MHHSSLYLRCSFIYCKCMHRTFLASLFAARLLIYFQCGHTHDMQTNDTRFWVYGGDKGAPCRPRVVIRPSAGVSTGEVHFCFDLPTPQTRSAY